MATGQIILSQKNCAKALVTVLCSLVPLYTFFVVGDADNERAVEPLSMEGSKSGDRRPTKYPASAEQAFPTDQEARKKADQSSVASTQDSTDRIFSKKLRSKDQKHKRSRSKQAQKKSIRANNKQSTDSDLREAIVIEAYELAIQSEDPVRSLISVALLQKRYGLTVDAMVTLDEAASRAQDYRESEIRSELKHAVVKGLLKIDQEQEALYLAHAIADKTYSSQAMGDVALSLARSGDSQRARFIIRAMNDHIVQEESLVRLVQLEAENTRFIEIESTLALIENPIKKANALKKGVRTLAKRGQFDSAVRLIDRIVETHDRDQALSDLAQAKVKIGDSVGAKIDVSRMSSVHAQDDSLAKLSVQLSKEHESDAARALALAISDPSKRDRAISQVIKQIARDGDIYTALKAVDQISTEKEKNRALGDVAVESVKSRGPGSARTLAQQISDPAARDSTMRGIAIASQALGHVRDAVRIAREIHEPAEKTIAYAGIAEREARSGDERLATKMLEEAAAAYQVVESPKQLDQVNKQLALAYAETASPEYAILSADRVVQDSQRNALFSKLTTVFARKDRLDLAEQSASNITTTSQRVKARDKMIKAYAKITAPKQALNSVQNIRSTNEKVAFLTLVARKI